MTARACHEWLIGEMKARACHEWPDAGEMKDPRLP